MTRRPITLPDAVRETLAVALTLAPEEAYLVGGSLRDALLVRPTADLDLAARGGAITLARALAGRLGGHFVELDAERGIARVALEEGPVRTVDVATLRGDIVADLGRRDFTIDALAVRLADTLSDEAEVLDPHGGLGDLASGTVRLVSEEALREDPLRLLRAVRLAVQLDFAIAPETEEAVRRHAALVLQAAAERRRDELVHCFATDRAAVALRSLDRLGLLDELLPEVTAGRGVEQPKEHAYDVFDHAIEAVAALDFLLADREPEGGREASFRRAFWEALAVAPGLRVHLAEEVSEGRSRATLLKLATLLHDVAKPETRAPDDTGRIRFFGHAERGAEIARDVMQRYRFSRREGELVATMVDEHLRPTQLGHEALPTRRALYRYYRDTGEAAESVLLLSLADAYSARGPEMSLEAWRGYVAYIAHVLARRDEDPAVARPVRLVTGEDVMAALGIAPGPAVGHLLAAIEEAQAAGEIAGREEALDLARRLHGHAHAMPAGALK